MVREEHKRCETNREQIIRWQNGKSNHSSKYIRCQYCKHPLQKGKNKLQLYAAQKTHTSDLKI